MTSTPGCRSAADGGPKIYEYIEPGKNQHLDGFHALWFARSRHADSDYARMARQKCVMNAMLNQLDPVTVLTKFNKIASAGKQIMATDMPTSEIDKLMELALKASKKPITSVAFVPPLVWPGSPDFAKVHAMVGDQDRRRRGRGRAEAQGARDRTPPAGSATPHELEGRATSAAREHRAARRETARTARGHRAISPTCARPADP